MEPLRITFDVYTRDDPEFQAVEIIFTLFSDSNLDKIAKLRVLEYVTQRIKSED